MARDKKVRPRAFHNGEPALRENRVDHGIFFRLARGGERIDFTHFTFNSHPAILVSRVDIDLACTKQQLNDGLVPLCDSIPQRRLAILAFRVGVDLACADQQPYAEHQLDDGLVPLCNGMPQWRPARVVSRVSVDPACAEQQPDNGLVPFCGGQRQWCPAIPVSHVDINLARRGAA